MTKWSIRVHVAFLVALLFGCTEPPGTVSLTFVWSDPPTAVVWLWTRVESRPGNAGVGETVAAMVPQAYQPGNSVTLALNDVANGADLVVVIEVRDGPSAGLPIRFFGASERFTLEPGKNVSVSIPIGLAKPAAVTQVATVQLLFGGEPRERITAEEIGAATLRVTASDSVAFLVSHDPSFTELVTRFEFGGEELNCWVDEGTTGAMDVCDSPGWDLTAGQAQVTDGPYALYVRFVDELGYESKTHAATVTLDSTPPLITAAVLSPPAVKNGDLVTLQVNLHEPMDLTGSHLYSFSGTGTSAGIVLEGPRQISQSHAYVWEATVDGEVADGEYRFELVTQDDLGNRSEPESLKNVQGEELVLTVDTHAVSVVSHQWELSYPSPSGDGVWVGSGNMATVGSLLKVELLLDEEPSLDSELVQLGPETLSGCTVNGLMVACEHTIVGDGTADVSTAPLTAVVRDEAGNLTQELLANLVLDFKPPGFASLPSLERQDGFIPATVEQNVLYASQMSVIRVTITADELLSTVPLLTVGERSIPVLSGALDGLTYLFDVDGIGAQEGDVDLFVEMTDMAGNQAHLVVGTIVYDFSAPAPLTSQQAQAIRFLRAPFGAWETAFMPTSRLDVCPGPPESAWDWCPESTGDLFADTAAWQLYRAIATEDGLQCEATPVAAAVTFGKPLGLSMPVSGDWPFTCVSRLDRAGNGSAPEILAFYRWITALTGKVAGSMLENPNLVQVVPHTTPTLRQEFASAEDQATADAVALPDDVGSTSVFGGVWSSYAPHGVGPSPRNHHALASDLARGELILFGGLLGDEGECSGSGGYCGDTWVWRKGRWTPVALTGMAPPPRFDHAMVWDAQRGKVVLVGGKGVQGVLADTWTWDGEEWSKELPQTPAPAVMQHTMVYDANRARVVLYGGCPKDSWCEELATGKVWEWDGTNWSHISPSGPAPAPSAEGALAYSSMLGVPILYLPRAQDWAQPSYELWAWHGSFWEELQSGDMPVYFGGTFGADPTGGLLLQGGKSLGSCELLERSWLWNGEWTKEETGPFPSGRTGSAMATNPIDGTSTLFGGVTDSNYSSECPPGPGMVRHDDVWQWNGERWRDVSPQDDWPLQRMQHAMTAHPISGQPVFFGGYGVFENGFGETDEMWSYDGANWQEVEKTLPWPAARRSAGIATDTKRGTLVLFGGGIADTAGLASAVEYGDTWEWDGVAWSQRALNGPAPSPRLAPAMTYDPKRERVVLFGGMEDGPVAADTWEWDGESWQEVDVLGPEGRAFAGMAYLPAMERVVLYGGLKCHMGCDFDNLDTIWTYDGESWTEMPTPLTGPGNRYGISLVSMPDRGRLLLYSGLETENDTTPLDCLWEWDGGSWTDLELPEQRPVAMDRYGMTWDAEIGGAVLFGGHDKPESYDESMWAWVNPPDGYPGVFFSVSVADSLALDSMDSLSVHALANGRGFTTDLSTEDDPDLLGDAINGAELLAWNAAEGRWVTLAENECGPGTPCGGLDAAMMSPQLIARHIVQGEGRVYLLVRPFAGNGNGPEPSSVGVDYLEIGVDYHRP